MLKKSFLGLLVIVLLCSSCQQETMSKNELVFTFFKSSWLKQDLDNSLKYTNGIKLESIEKEVKKVPNGYWDGINTGTALYYRSEKIEADTYTYYLYSPLLRVYIETSLQKTSGNWKITQISSQVYEDTGLLADKISNKEWKSKEIILND